MTITSCPTDEIEAPIEVVWRLLMDPGDWGTFYGVRVLRPFAPGAFDDACDFLAIARLQRPELLQALAILRFVINYGVAVLSLAHVEVDCCVSGDFRTGPAAKRKLCKSEWSWSAYRTRRCASRKS